MRSNIALWLKKNGAEGDWSDGTADSAFALQVPDLGLITSTP